MRRFDFWFLLFWLAAAATGCIVGVAIHHAPLQYMGLGVFCGISVGESVWKDIL